MGKGGLVKAVRYQPLFSACKKEGEKRGVGRGRKRRREGDRQTETERGTETETDRQSM